MKCKQCGTVFEGKFCPECGAQTENVPPVVQTAPSIGQKKRKKPFFLRWWFLFLVLLAAVLLILSLGGNRDKKIDWNSLILSEILPTPPSLNGTVQTNSDEELWIEIDDFSASQYNNYRNSCKDAGFCVDTESTTYSYDAYNAEGYRLSLSHYGNGTALSICLEAPMEMDTIRWPAGSAGQQLPVPKSTVGEFAYEYDDHFFVYIGNTSMDDYNEYVAACSEKGFLVDYDKGEDYYYAENSTGWRIAVCYEGNRTMSIEISAPDDSSNSSDVSSSTPSSSAPESKPVTSEKEESGLNSLDPDFKAAMDSYESFMDEYVAFMKKYMANPSDLTLLADYTKYMTKYAEFATDFNKWNSEEMNAAETAYYLEVQTRVNQKLLEVTG